MKTGEEGGRGGAWVIAQVLLIGVLLFAPGGNVEWGRCALIRAFGAGFALAGLALLAWSFVSLGKSLTPFPRPLATARLVTSGPYRLVRHPIYFALLLLALGLACLTLSPARFAMTVMLALFFDRKSAREERWLVEKYPEYPAYRLTTKKLIPWVV